MYNISKKIISLTLIFVSLVVADEWNNGPFLNTPRAGATAVTWDGKIYVFGGRSGGNVVLNTVEMFDPQSGSWDNSSIPAFPTARYNASAVIFENKIYLIGGRTINDVLKVVEVYDPVQNKWEEAHELRKEREGHTTGVFNDRIYTIGGQKNSNTLVEDIEWYNAEEDDWKEAAFNLPYPRSAHFAVIYQDDYYCFGGYYYGLNEYGYRTVHQPDFTYSWKTVNSLSMPRAYGAVARIDSLIYIIGGETEQGKTNLVETYNLNSGLISKGSDMNMSHSGMASAVLNNKIYVIGGYEGSKNDIINHVHILTPSVTAINDHNTSVPENISLVNAYPNPFNGRVRIEVELVKNSNLSVEIMNVLGKRINILENSPHLKGKYSYFWDAKDAAGQNVSSGVFFVRITADSYAKILKLIYVK